MISSHQSKKRKKRNLRTLSFTKVILLNEPCLINLQKGKTIPDQLYKQLKDFRKESAVENVPELYKVCMTTLTIFDFLSKS